MLETTLVYIDRTASEDNLSYAIVHFRYVFIGFSFKELVFTVATDTGSLRRILNGTHVYGKLSHS